MWLGSARLVSFSICISALSSEWWGSLMIEWVTEALNHYLAVLSAAVVIAALHTHWWLMTILSYFLSLEALIFYSYYFISMAIYEASLQYKSSKFLSLSFNMYVSLPFDMLMLIDIFRFWIFSEEEYFPKYGFPNFYSHVSFHSYLIFPYSTHLEVRETYFYDSLYYHVSPLCSVPVRALRIQILLDNKQIPRLSNVIQLSPINSNELTLKVHHNNEPWEDVLA